MLKIGPIVLVLTMILLTGCGQRPIAVGRAIPNYKASFLDCVAQEYATGKHGPCTKEVEKDWAVMVGI